MLDSINISVNAFDWKSQSVRGVNVANLLANIQSGMWRSKKVKLDLTAFQLESYYFSCEDLFDFCVHYKLVENADLNYPVILNNKGIVIDGRHRIVKAILQGIKSIDGIQIIEEIKSISNNRDKE